VAGGLKPSTQHNAQLRFQLWHGQGLLCGGVLHPEQVAWEGRDAKGGSDTQSVLELVPWREVQVGTQCCV
jgi:hypothetical protein